MNNNKKQSNLQFTKLTPDDIATHEDLYIDILPKATWVSTGAFMSQKTRTLLYNYNFKELQKAKQLFQKTFGQ